MSRSLINKIYYGNATEETRTCDLPHWFVLRSEPEELGARIMHMHAIADIVARVLQA